MNCKVTKNGGRVSETLHSDSRGKLYAIEFILIILTIVIEMIRYKSMRTIFSLIALILFFKTNGQSCIPNTKVSVEIHPSKRGLKPTDSNLTIVSFKLRAEKLCSDQQEDECVNTGAVWNEARRIINKACPGTIVEFSCIKAEDEKGRVYILQPLIMTLESKKVP